MHMTNTFIVLIEIPNDNDIEYRNRFVIDLLKEQPKKKRKMLDDIFTFYDSC